MKKELRVAIRKHYGGLGLPVIDLYAPTKAELAAGRETLREAFLQPALPPALVELKSHAFADVAAAEVAVDELDTYWRSHGIKPGDKVPVEPADLPRIAEWFLTMRKGARAVNKASEFLERPEAWIKIRHVGGSLTNKLHALRAGLGEQAEAHMYGLTGHEDGGDNLRFLEKSIGDSKIDFVQPAGTKLDAIPQNYIVLLPNGERINLQSPVDGVSQKMRGHEKDIARFTGKLDTVLIEGSDLGTIKFGAPIFSAFAEDAMRSAKEIVFAPPTNVRLVIGDSTEVQQNRALFDRIIDHPRTTLITMNEEEAVGMFLGEKMDKDHDGPLHDHPQLQRALAALRQRLAAKEAALPEGSLQPVAFVSAGRAGAYAVTAGGIIHAPLLKVEKKDALGAGDSFVAGAMLRREAILIGKAGTGSARFTDEDLRGMLQTGQELAGAVVAQKGTQLPPARVAEVLYGEVPTIGTLAETVDLPARKVAR